MNKGSDHVFISYSSKDFSIAMLVCQTLEEQNITCWMAPRDITYGEDYADEITRAIKTCRAFLLIITKNSDDSKHVKNEIEFAVNKDIRKYAILLDNHQMSLYLQYHFSRIQMATIQTPVTAEKLSGLIKALKDTSVTNVHEQSTKLQKTLKHNLPAQMPMVGRESEFGDITSSLNEEVQYLMIMGMTGIGKTTLANNVSHKLINNNNFDVIVWLTSQDGSLTFEAFLEQLALVLDDQYLNRLEPSEREKAAYSLLQKKAFLFIINDVKEVYDEKVFKFLNRITNEDSVIITSDVSADLFDNCKTITLQGLNKEEVRQLLHLEGKRIGLKNLGEVPVRIIRDLHRLSSGNPYVIKLSIGQIKAGIPFERVLLGLQQARGRVFDDVFTKSWSILDEDQKDLLMCLSLFRGSASSEALQYVSDINDWDFVEDISTLINYSLVETNGAFLIEDIRYSVLPLTRSFASNKLQESDKISKFYKNYVDYFSEFILENHKNFSILTNELENLRIMIAWVKENDPRSHLKVIRNLYPFFRDTGHWDEAIENYLQAIESNQQFKDLESDVSYARCELVSFYIRQGGDEALKKSDIILDEALVIFSELNDKKGLCAAFGRKARVAQKRYDYNSALSYGKKALDIAQQNNLTSRIADISHELGDTYFYLEDYENAKELYTQSLTVYQKLDNVIRTIGRFNDLGRLACKTGNHTEARQLLEKSIALAEKHNKLDTLCRAYINIAYTLLKLGEKEAAQGFATKGEELAIKLRAEKEVTLAQSIAEKITDS